MKKVILLVSVVAFMASCTKDYSCDCTFEFGGEDSTSSADITAKPKDAETLCDATESELQAFDSAASCSLNAK